MKSVSFLAVIVLEIAALAAMAMRDGRRDSVSRQRETNNAHLVETLMLTDLALWTEARYTRHPSQADGFTAFQDGPAALDHFPSGAWVRPAQHGNSLDAITRRQK